MNISMGRMSVSGTLPCACTVNAQPTARTGRTDLAGGLVQPEVVPELLLRDRAGRVDLVPEDEERHLRELLDREELVELGLALGEALEVGAVDEEDDTVDLGEVVAPQPARCGRVSGRVDAGRRAGDAPCKCPPRS
jgi:hypothetical protein